MKSLKFPFFIIAALIGVPAVVFAAGSWTEPTATAPAGNVNGPVWLSPSTVQTGSIFVSSNIETQSGDLSFRTSGKSIRVDAAGASVLNISNYNTGSTDSFTLNIAGDIAVTAKENSTGKISAPLLCIGTDCRNAWPTGGGGSGDITDVQAGTGITVTNGTGPIPTISANFTTTQARISSSCSAGYSIRSVDAAGGVTCEYDDTGISSESDPQVGSLSNGSWCTSNGSTVNCTSAAPTVTESDPQVGAVTSGYWCKGTGSTVACSYTAPTQSDSSYCAVNTAVGGMAKLEATAYAGSLYLSSSAKSCSNSGWSFVPHPTDHTLSFKDENGNTLYEAYNATAAAVYKIDSTRKWRALTWALTSDGRLKNVKKDYSSGLDVVNELNPKVFTWKSEEKDLGAKALLNVGFIAQDVRKVLPEAVTATPGDSSGLSGGQLSIDTTAIIAVSVNAIQELSAENDALKDEVSDLKARLSAIEEKLK